MRNHYLGVLHVFGTIWCLRHDVTYGVPRFLLKLVAWSNTWERSVYDLRDGCDRLRRSWVLVGLPGRRQAHSSFVWVFCSFTLNTSNAVLWECRADTSISGVCLQQLVMIGLAVRGRRPLTSWQLKLDGTEFFTVRSHRWHFRVSCLVCILSSDSYA